MDCSLPSSEARVPGGLRSSLGLLGTARPTGPPCASVSPCGAWETPRAPFQVSRVAAVMGRLLVLSLARDTAPATAGTQGAMCPCQLPPPAGPPTKRPLLSSLSPSEGEQPQGTFCPGGR